MYKISPDSTSKCPHCKGESETGTRGGCSKCGKDKHTVNGRQDGLKIQR